MAPRKQKQKLYTVKDGKQTTKITKDELKARNLRMVMEFKTAGADRRGELLNEYFHLNRSFVTYFPRFHGDYREEIINTFVCSLPDYFMKFDLNAGIDVNSYLGMFAKKNAVREFLYLLTTVQHNRFYKDETGQMVVEKPHMTSLDAISSSAYAEEPDAALDYFLGQHVFKDFLTSGRDAAEEYLDGAGSYSLAFTGVPAEIVKDFESGLKWAEVQKKHGISSDKFLSIMFAIRVQLQRIMKHGGKDVRFFSRAERSARDAARPPKRAVRRSTRSIHEHGQDEGPSWTGVSADYGDTSGSFGRADEAENQGPFFVESDGPETWSEGERA